MIFIHKKIARVSFFNKKIKNHKRMLNEISSVKPKKIVKTIKNEYINFIKTYLKKNYEPYYLEMEIKKSYLD